jgi:cobalamin-dependent methionine synthase I
MLLVGELINSSRKEVGTEIKEKNTQRIQELAQSQIEAGATYLDVNCGTLVFEEVETMKWLVKSILEVNNAPLCIDSPSKEALAAGLEEAKVNGKQQMINSITAESVRFNAILPLVKQYKTKVIALCLDDNGMPNTADDRIDIAHKLVKGLIQEGVQADDIYLDPLVKPVSVNDQYGLEVLQAIAFIRDSYPDVHIICGASNISFGLPKRKAINRAFVTLCMAKGMDAFIIDPLDQEMVGLLFSAQLLLGNDANCRKYLGAFKKKQF